MAVAVLLVVAGFGAATTAAAHSQLDRSNPADGARVAALPEQIKLTFNLNVLGLGAAVQVTGPEGNIADGRPTVVDKQLRQAVRPGSVAGDYTVLWRVTSADGHPISGRFTFSVAAGSGGADSAESTSAASTSAPTAPSNTASAGVQDGTSEAAPTAGSAANSPSGGGGAFPILGALVLAFALPVIGLGLFMFAWSGSPFRTKVDAELRAKRDANPDPAG